MPSGIQTLFGGSSQGEKKLRRARPTGFTSGGLSGSFNRDTRTFDVTRSSQLTQGLTDLQSRLGGRASAFRGLRDSDTFDNLVEGRAKAIRDAGTRTVGNLREELGRRRVAGSSFAEREIAGVEASFAQQESLATAEGRRDQLSAEVSLIDQEFQASVDAAAVMVDQLNLESNLAAQLGVNASAQMLERARLRAELDAAVEGAQIEWAAMERGFAHDYFAGGGGGMFGGMGGGAAAASDRRLKRNIVRLGTRDGYPWYSFDYVWGEHSEGVMSDEIPQQFVMQVSGYDVVDYGALFGGG